MYALLRRMQNLNHKPKLVWLRRILIMTFNFVPSLHRSLVFYPFNILIILWNNFTFLSIVAKCIIKKCSRKIRNCRVNYCKIQSVTQFNVIVTKDFIIKKYEVDSLFFFQLDVYNTDIKTAEI